MIGRNVRALRIASNLRQEDIANEARRAGLKWNVSRVAELENGTLGISVSALVLVALSLSERIGRPVTLAELAAGDEGIALSGSVWVDNWVVQAAFEGEGVTNDIQRAVTESFPGQTYRLNENGSISRAEVTGISPASHLAQDAHSAVFDLATVRAARRLNIAPEELEEFAQQKYGRTIARERDFRAGAGASQQKRGAIMRALTDEIRDLQDGRDNG